MNLLRQSTSQVIRFGPLLDSTDGVTPETGLTIAQADMQLSKDGGAFAQKNAAGNAAHDADGWYSTTLNTTDTATNGIMLLQVTVAGALPVWHEYYVVPSASYDALTTDGMFNFDASSDTVANVTNTANVTGNVAGSVNSVATAVTVGTMNANVINAASIAASALNGKGDWNIGKTGYTLTQTFPANFADISISATTGLVDITQVAADKVWLTAARVLTAGTNIVLAKGVGVTGFNDITATDVLAAGDVDGFSLEEAQKLILAASVGVLAGAATTSITIDAADGSKTRITATVDADGNRTAVIKDVTG